MDLKLMSIGTDVSSDLRMNLRTLSMNRVNVRTVEGVWEIRFRFTQ